VSSVLLLIAGLAGLLIGAELLVRGGSKLAIRLGITPIVIGLTVVSIGTSMPELAIGIDAARRSSPGLAVGNIVGTNLVNLLLILEISALIRPIPLDSRILRFDLPAMAAASVLVFIMARDRFLDRVEGVVLFFASVGYTVVILRTSRKESAQLRAEFSTKYAAPEPDDKVSRPVLDLIYLVGGIIVIVVGADLLVVGRLALPAPLVLAMPSSASPSSRSARQRLNW
jgi:cation:H+ antiporter